MSPPAVLHISQGSREVGLHHYTLEFGNREGDDYQVNEKAAYKPFLYINWEVDIIFPTTQDAADGLVHHLPYSSYRVAVDAAHKDNLYNLRPLLEYDYTLRDLWEVLVFRTMEDVDIEAISQRVKNAQPIECQFLLPENLEQSGQISELGALVSADFINFSETMKDEIRERMEGDPDESDCSDYGSKIAFGMMEIKTL